MTKNNTWFTVFIIVFAAFIVAGLVIAPAFEDAEAKKRGKKGKNKDFTIDEPLIPLVKDVKKLKSIVGF